MNGLEVRGNDRVLASLAATVSRPGFQRTLLFSGPDGVGRRRAAAWLAAYLNCLASPQERPCGVCASCQAVAAGESLDHREVAPHTTSRTGRSRHRAEIRIGQLVPREKDDEPDPLVPWLQARPFGRFRVAVIDDAHTMNANAANAFLKTLEEPPERAVIVLVAPGPETLMPTVASRALNFRFAAVALEDGDLESHPAVRLGQPGLAERARENREATEAARAAANALLESVRGDLLQALEGAEELAKTLGSSEVEGAEPGPLGWLRESLRALPPAVYARAQDALGDLEDALAAYANQGLACATFALRLRSALADSSLRSAAG